MLILASAIATGTQAQDQVARAPNDEDNPSEDESGACHGSAAIQYLKLIEAMDWQTMHRRLAKDARYLDPTMIHYQRPAIDLTGPDEIVGFWHTSSAQSGTSSIRYQYTRCFETAGFHVVHYEIAVEVSGEPWGLTQDRVTIPGQVMSVIRIVDGLVAEHRDYVDYASADRYLDELQRGAQQSPAQKR